MEWYNYLAAFFAGVFLSNATPHFIYGIAGDKFPTPFAKPPGKGLSSSTVNVIWALVNLIIGFLLVRAGNVTTANTPSLIVCFIGFAAMSIMMSITFQKKDKE